MTSTPWRFSLVGSILLAYGAVACGGSYADPSGFSFTYPDGWVPITRAVMGDANQFVPPEVKDWIARNKVDLSRVAVTLIRNGQDDFLENLNVVVDPQQIPVNDKTVKELTGVLRKQYAAMGVEIDNLQGGVQRLGTHDAVVLEYQARMPAVPYTLRQRQVMFPGGGKTYIVTCTAKADSFDRYKLTFEQIVASFQVPAPVARGFDWNQVLTTGIVGGVVGAFVGGLFWLAKRLFSKAKPKRQSDRSAEGGVDGCD